MNEIDINSLVLDKLFSLFHGIPKNVQKDITGASLVKSYPNKAIIFSNKLSLDYLYLVIEGTVHIVRDDNEGKEHIISILRDGDFFPHVGLFENTTPGFAHTAEKTVILQIPIDFFRKIALDYPSILIRYSKELSKKVIELQSRLEEKAFYSTYEQIVRRLLFLVEEYGEKMDNGKVELKISLTHEELAHLVGTTRETVSRSLTKLKKTGAIEKINGKWIINVFLLIKQTKPL